MADIARPAAALDPELLDLLDDLDGFAWMPGMDLILAGVRQAAEAAADGSLTLDETQTQLAVIAQPGGTDLTELLALLARTLTSPTHNRALDQLDADTAKTVQRLGEVHAHETAVFAVREHTNQAAGLIAPS